MDSPQAHIASLALAVPHHALDQAQAHAALAAQFGPSLASRTQAAMRKIFAHPSVQRRRFAFAAAHELFHETPDERMDRFTRWAVALAAAAADRALDQAALRASDVTGLVVNTCTGYLCPGLSTYLVERLGLSPHLPVYDLVGCGCAGAAPNLHAAERLLEPGGAVLSVCVEVCSATFRMGDALDLVVSNAIFGDGAAAAVLWPRPQGLALVDSAGVHLPGLREHIRYVYRDGHLQNPLSPELPDLLKAPVAETVRRVLDRHGLSPSDVPHWALHPGGAKVVDAVRDELGLTETQLASTRRALAQYGNVSSASAWFVMHDILTNGAAPDAWYVLATFGAGFSAYAHLMQARGLPRVGQVCEVRA